MNHDEFGNKTQPSEGFGGRSEFGNTQTQEFSSYKDNPDKRTTSLNPTDIINDTGKESDKQRPTPNPQKKTDTTQKAEKIARAIHSTTVVATVAAAGAVTGAIGIKVVNQTNAEVTIVRFVGNEDFFEYELVLHNATEEDPFSIKLENKEYSKSYLLQPGENYGFFEGLTPGSSYQITIAQDRLGGNVLYNEVYTANPYAEFWGAEIGEFDFDNHVFTVSLSYEDMGERLSNFALLIQTANGEYRQFPLQKTHEFQTLSFAETDFRPGMETTYCIQYGDYSSVRKSEYWRFEIPGHKDPSSSEEPAPSSEEPILSSEEPIPSSEEPFSSEEPPASSEVVGPTITEVLFDPHIDFNDPKFSLTLHYDDPDGLLDGFALQIEGKDGVAATYSLEPSTSMQTVNLSDLGLGEDNAEFTLSIRYLYNLSEEWIYEIGQITFINTPVAEFIRLDFDSEFDYADRIGYVTLVYSDDSNVLSDFILQMQNGDDQVEIPLDHTSEPQAISLEGFSGLDPSGTEFSYTFYYYDGRYGQMISVVGETALKDSDYVPREASLDGVIFNKTMDFASGKFSVTLNLDDSEDRISDIVLTLNSESGASQDFALEHTSADQELIFMRPLDGDFNVGLYSYTYSLSFNLDGETRQLVYDEPFRFENSCSPAFLGLECPFVVTSDFYLPIHLDVVDPEGTYQYAHLVFSDIDGYEVFSTHIEGELNQWRYLELDPTGTLSPGSYNLRIYLADEAGEQLVYHEGISLSEATDSAIYGVDFGGEAIIEKSDGIMAFNLFYSQLDGITDTVFYFNFSDTVYSVSFDPSALESRFDKVVVKLGEALTPEDYETLLGRLSSEPVDVSVGYYGPDGQPQESYSYKGMMFAIYD